MTAPAKVCCRFCFQTSLKCHAKIAQGIVGGVGKTQRLLITPGTNSYAADVHTQHIMTSLLLQASCPRSLLTSGVPQPGLSATKAVWLKPAGIATVSHEQLQWLLTKEMMNTLNDRVSTATSSLLYSLCATNNSTSPVLHTDPALTFL